MLKNLLKAFGATLIFVLVSVSAVMADDTDSMSESEQPGTMGETTESGKMDSKGKMDKSMAAMAKKDVAPHSVRIQTSLQSAIDEIKGLKTELQVAEPKPSSRQISNFKTYGKEIGSDLKMAMSHQTELKGSVQKFPEIASSEEFKAVDTSLNEAEKAHREFQSKMNKSDYWANRTQVNSDLDMLEKKLTAASEKTKSFNSDQLDVTWVG